MADRVIRPTLAFEWPLFARPLITNLSQGLCGLDRAEMGDLVGVALYHEISGVPFAARIQCVATSS